MTIGDSVSVRSYALGRRTGRVIAMNLPHRHYTVALETDKGTIHETFWTCDKRDLITQPVKQSCGRPILFHPWNAGLNREQAAQKKREMLRDIHRMRDEGASIETIGLALNMGKTTVSKWLRKEAEGQL